jgi:hypothetical protein
MPAAAGDSPFYGSVLAYRTLSSASPIFTQTMVAALASSLNANPDEVQKALEDAVGLAGDV